MPDSEFQFISFAPVPDVDGWVPEVEKPTGTREKTTLIDPCTGQHHIFKLPKERREHQIWSELLGSFIAGDLLGWNVQHTGIGRFRGQMGNILRYFFDPGSKSGENTSVKETFTEGWNLCTQIDADFDVDKGTRHTLPLLMRVCDEIIVPDYRIRRESFLDFWARAFALDCLISNTDRHAENWGIIEGRCGARMAPLYDNGSSLGCGLDQIGLDRAFDQNQGVLATHLERQRKNGRHHVRANEPAKKGALFEEICEEFLRIYPEGKCRFRQAVNADIDAVDGLMDVIGRQGEFGEPYRLSTRRRKHIHAMLQIGQERIRNVLARSQDND